MDNPEVNKKLKFVIGITIASVLALIFIGLFMHNVFKYRAKKELIKVIDEFRETQKKIKKVKEDLKKFGYPSP